jgi:hypothetical protein
MLLVTIDKFDPNPLIVNINKLKPYRFIKDQTLQPIIVKPSDLLLKKPIEIGQSNNFFIKKPDETNHSSNLFIKDSIKSHNEGITINKRVEKKTSCDMSKQEAVEESTNNLLKMQLVKIIFVSLIPTQTNDISTNLVTSVSFL